MAARITIQELTGLQPKHAIFVAEYVKDFAARRAAEAAGFAPDTGYQLLNREDVQQAIDNVLLKRLAASDIDAEWLLMEAVDNHEIARQHGNLAASNSALNLIAKHVMVDAFAAEKVQVSSDKEIIERLARGRKRMLGEDEETDDISFF